MQVLGGPTHILIWGRRFEIAKGALISRGDLKFYGASMNHNDVMTIPAGDGGPKNQQSKIGML